MSKFVGKVWIGSVTESLYLDIIFLCGAIQLCGEAKNKV